MRWASLGSELQKGWRASPTGLFPAPLSGLNNLPAGPRKTHRLGTVRGTIGKCQRAVDGAGRAWRERHTHGATGPGGDTRPAGVTGYREAGTGYGAGKGKGCAQVIRQRHGLGRAGCAHRDRPKIQTAGRQSDRCTAGPGESDCLGAVRGIVGECERSGGVANRRWRERHTDGATGSGSDTRPAGVTRYGEAGGRRDAEKMRVTFS